MVLPPEEGGEVEVPPAADPEVEEVVDADEVAVADLREHMGAAHAEAKLRANRGKDNMCNMLKDEYKP